jgi:hypothetical protein
MLDRIAAEPTVLPADGFMAHRGKDVAESEAPGVEGLRVI